MVLRPNATEMPEYRSWEAMRARCNNKNHKHYEYYGGRGIQVCAEWDSFWNFYSDMGRKPEGFSLDRIDPNGNYCRENCRWTNGSEQAYNTRMQENNTTGKTGVVLDKRTGRYYARIDFKGKSIHLGSSMDFEEAVKMRESAELKYFGYTKN